MLFNTLILSHFSLQPILAKPVKPQYRHCGRSPCGTRKAPFKQWAEEDLKLASMAVVTHGWTIRRAAEEFGVPRSTLFDRVSGRIQFGARSGPSRYLNDQEEKELVRFLLGCAKIGFARSRQDVLAIVRATVAKKQGKDPDEVCVTTGWWNSFRKRHPKLTLRSASRLAYHRAIAQDPEIFRNYFDLLEETLTQNGLLDDPVRTFNCDESGFPLEHKPGKVISAKGTKSLNLATSGDKAQITVLACASASGYALPPLIIFDRKRLKPEHTKGEVPGTIYGLSHNGWIDSEIFEEWFEKHFLTHVPPTRPLLLLLDGHSSHYQPSFVRKAAKSGIIVFCLPPHTSHLTQPLDRTCFSPLKSAWHQECHLFMSMNPGKVVNRYNFTELFANAWIRAMNLNNVIAGFKCTGICPFDRFAIKIPGCESSADEEESLAEKTGLKYVPLFSPAPKPRAQVSFPTSLSKSFTEEECLRFKTRWENGYDLEHDQRYNDWVRIHHPDCHTPPKAVDFDHAKGKSSIPIFPGYSSDEEAAAPSGTQSPSPSDAVGKISPPASVLSSLLVVPPAPAKVKKSTSGAARVLTSTENLEILQEKERKKQELQEEKARRKEERARKAQEREEKKREKERLRQKKEAERAARQKGKCKPSRKARKCSRGVMKRGANSRSMAQSHSVEEAGSSEPGGWSVSTVYTASHTGCEFTA